MRRGRISLFLAALLVAGCSKEDPPSPPPPPPAKPAPPEPALPALGEVRFRDWDEVDDEKFLELTAPDPAPALKWDFSPDKRYGYDFAETVSQRTHQEANGKQATNNAREKNRGLFDFACGRDRTALSIAKIQTQEAFLNDQLIDRESYAKKPASTLECVIAEDGTPDFKQPKGTVDARMYYQSLFALQPGTRPLSSGKITTRLAGFRKVGRYECARLESEFEILNEAPSAKLLLRGRVVGYFAVAERKFIRTSAVLATSSRANVLAEKGFWVTNSIDSVTSSRVRYLEPP